MHPPIVEFQFDERFDVEIGTDFLNAQIGRYDFGYDRIIALHPSFLAWRKLTSMKRRVLVRKYVRAYYASHRPEMTRARGKMQQIWNRIGERYFRELERVFGPLSFYRPKHIQAKLSIFRCGVVDGNLRAFQIWYGTVGEPSEVRRHVAHEILHFYYYTYLKRRGYAKLSKDWDLAEIFNRIILNQPRLLRLTKKRDMGYSAHTRRVPKYRELWERSRGIEPYLQTLNRRAKGGE